MPAYYERFSGAVISSAIDKYIHVTVKHHSPLFQEAYRLNYSKTEHAKSIDAIENDIARECLRLVPVDSPLYIATASDLPSSSGLGSSSSFAVGLLHALHLLRGEVITPAQLAEEACAIEIDILRSPVGKQDQYIAAFGGLNHFNFRETGRVEIDHLVLENDLANKILENSLLIWTGIQRSAGNLLLKQGRVMNDRLSEYDAIKKSTDELKHLLLNPPDDFLRHFGALVNKTWEIKKRYQEDISSLEIDQLHASIYSNGGYGGKLCGAGGGGFLYEVFEEARHKEAIELFGKERVVRVAYEPLGSRLLSAVY